VSHTQLADQAGKQGNDDENDQRCHELSPRVTVIQRDGHCAGRAESLPNSRVSLVKLRRDLSSSDGII
jgi:hypothetical protein